MTTDRAPVEIPEEMVRAAADALAGYPLDEGYSVSIGQATDLARSALSAALRVVLSDPCPTCSARWGEPPPARKAKGSGTCPDEFHNSPPPPVWAWLRVAQDAGMVEHAPFGAVATEIRPLFRPASTPENPEVTE